jgi:hypothetical protein
VYLASPIFHPHNKLSKFEYNELERRMVNSDTPNRSKDLKLPVVKIIFIISAYENIHLTVWYSLSFTNICIL